MTFLPRAGGMRRGRFGHCPLSQGSLASHSPHPLGHRGPDPGRGAPRWAFGGGRAPQGVERRGDGASPRPEISACTPPPPRPWAQLLAPVTPYLSASESDTSASPSQSRRWLGPGLGGQQDLGGPKPGPSAPGRLAGDSECVRGGGGCGPPGSGYSHRARNEERALRMPRPWCPDCTHCLAMVQPQPRPPRASPHTLQGSVP